MNIKTNELINVHVLRRLIPQAPGKCERCNYDPVDPDAVVADYYQDCYLALCTECAEQLHKLQARQSSWGEY